MRKRYNLSDQSSIEVDLKPIASGGEADIYAILSPPRYANHVVKLYRKGKASEEKEKKLAYMVQHRPHFSTSEGHHSVVWPSALAYDSQGFVGYIMPKATGIKLELLCHPNLPKTINKEWDKLSFQHPLSLDLRKKICYNIAAAIALIHESESYVLVDLKPDNIIIKPDGLVSIIDVDSTEIIDQNEVVFSAHVATPEYTPPEFYAFIKDISTQKIPETWDRFSLAVLFYRVLFGIHPFTGTLNPPFEKHTNVSEIIERGFFVQGVHASKFKVIPPPHKRFRIIDSEVKELFVHALDTTKNRPEFRPKASDWCHVLTPNPGMHLDRRLPSQTGSFGNPVYSDRLVFSTISSITLHKPGFLHEPVNTKFFSKLKSLLKTNERVKLYDSIKSHQQELERIEFDIYQKRNGFKQEMLDLTKAQNAILATEKAVIDNLIQQFLVKMHAIDKIAKNLFVKETGELQPNTSKTETEKKKSLFSLKEVLVGDNSQQNEKIRTDYDALHTKLAKDVSALDTSLAVEISKVHDKTRQELFNLFNKQKQVKGNSIEVIAKRKGEYDSAAKELMAMIGNYLEE